MPMALLFLPETVMVEESKDSNLQSLGHISLHCNAFCCGICRKLSKEFHAATGCVARRL